MPLCQEESAVKEAAVELEGVLLAERPLVGRVNGVITLNRAVVVGEHDQSVDQHCSNVRQLQQSALLGLSQPGSDLVPGIRGRSARYLSQVLRRSAHQALRLQQLRRGLR